jgi:hypothetical protein
MINEMTDEEIDNKIIEFKNCINKYKILSLLTIIIQFIFNLIRIILEYIYTLPSLKEEHQKNSIFFISVNSIILIMIIIVIIIQNINFLILSALYYLVYGFIIFLYIFIQKYSSTPSHSKPIDYFECKIDLINAILYYLSGILLFIGSLFIFLFVKNLSNFNTLKKNKQKRLEERLINNNEEFTNNEGLFKEDETL